MRRALSAIVAAVALAGVAAPPARAQMAGAFGKPLEDGSLPAGTVTVRIMRSAPGAKGEGIAVTMIGPGGARVVVTTGADERARFDGLAAGGPYVAEIAAPGAPGGVAKTEPFAVPAQGGLRLMLSPDALPAEPAPSAPSAAAPATPNEFAQPGMPDPRQMSGIPRPELGDPAGRLTVRVLQGSVVQNAPAGTPVHLIAVKADGSVSKQTRLVDDGGRVSWDRLAVDGSTAYYTLAVLTRGALEDRLMSAVVAPPPQVGIRLMLAGFAADSAEPAIDDLAEQGGATVPPGVVVVDLRGDLADVREVELIEVGQPDQPKKAVVGPADSGLTARFSEVAAGPDRVYQAIVRVGGRPFRSIPFQLTAARGASVGLIVWANLIFGFHMGGELDDERVWFQAQFALANATGAPVDPGPEGILIPLPLGFVGASLDEESALRVGIDKDRGFIWRGALPPGQREFVGTFALPVDDGRVAFEMPVPYGLLNGQIIIGQLPGVKFELPPGAKQEVRSSNGRAFVVLSGLTARPGERIRVAMAGLPQRPAWQRLAPLAVGFAVLGLLGWGIFGVASRRRAAGADGEGDADGPARRRELEARRERLYDQLVDLTRRQRGGHVAQPRYAREGANLVKQLEKVYAELRAAEALESEIARMGQGRRPAADRAVDPDAST